MSNIHILNLSAYTSPQINESKKGQYVEYGADNNYFQFLIDRYLYSTTNNAIISGCSNMIYGKGISALDGNKKPDEYAKMLSLIKPNALRKVALERKLLGMAAMQIGYDKGQVSFIEHFPMNTLRAEKCNDKGEIEAWYYHPNWANKKPSEEVKRIPAFGFGNKKDVEIYVIKPYLTGFHYYTPVEYSGCLTYALMEEEVADYLINDIRGDFSGTKIINFNNNIPSEEKREQIANDVKQKLTGSKGQKTIVSFNASKENQTEVIDVPLNDAPAHYEYLAKECFEKLIEGHKVTSPMLLGIRDTGGGFSNNADEIKTSLLMYDNLVIKPYQLEIIEALDTILAVNNIKLKLYFKTIQPLEFTDLENAQTAEQVAEETGVNLSAHTHPDLADALIDKGEVLSDEWHLIDENEVDYELEAELDAEIEKLNKKKEQSLFSKIVNLVSTGTARPRTKSEDDKEIDGVNFITRYVYSGDTKGERDFCNKMVSAEKVYRKEDILAMDNVAVNAGFGKNGADTYSIWLYKGGPRCSHKWLRRTYASFDTKIDPTNPNAKPLSIAKAEKYGYRLRNPKEVAMKPKDMPYKGYTKEYWEKKGFKN